MWCSEIWSINILVACKTRLLKKEIRKITGSLQTLLRGEKTLLKKSLIRY
jgi:hypothetical protein